MTKTTLIQASQLIQASLSQWSICFFFKE